MPMLTRCIIMRNLIRLSYANRKRLLQQRNLCRFEKGGSDLKTQTFLIRCEYPEGDHIPTQEFVENIQEYFAANIMDGERGRLVVKPVYQPKEDGLYKTESRIPTISELCKFVSLVKRMREAQEIANRAMVEADDYSEALIYVNKANELEREVDEYLKKM